jgi:heavy metal sensor kinase
MTMRSIRLSLTVYFLVLLALALGGASLLFYRIARNALEDKEKAAQELIQASYREDCRKEHEKLDTDLLKRARSVAQLVRPRQDDQKINQLNNDFRLWSNPQTRPALQAGQLLLTGGMNTTAVAEQLSLTLWSHNWWGGHDRRTSWFAGNLHWAFLTNIKPQIRVLTESIQVMDEELTDYIQINSVWGTAYHSPSMKGRQFAFDPSVFNSPTPPADLEKPEDVSLARDQVVRRVTLLTTAPRFVPGFGSGRPGPGAGRARPAGERNREEIQGRPIFYIQYACDTHKRDTNLEEFAQKRDEKLLQVSEKTRDSLLALRTRLLIIIGLSFAAMALGTFCVIRLGLAPLNRLSDAVSRVSERDFRLQFDSRRMPSELRPIHVHLNETLEQLKRAFAREKQATADISHELRTPLAALMTTIDVTLRKPRSAEEYRDALEDCRASGDQIHQAVERLLALARLDAGVDQLRSQAIDATALAQQCVAMVKPLAEARGLKVEVEGDSTAPLQTDPDKLREVLNNLLHNAIHYNRPNGSVAVAVHRENGHLHLAVRDTGIGIPPEARPHIFERFFRADPSRQADSLHAGLGLAIVKGYLDLMGGTIEVNSVEGEGSTFSVCLPA